MNNSKTAQYLTRNAAIKKCWGSILRELTLKHMQELTPDENLYISAEALHGCLLTDEDYGQITQT